MRLIEDWQHGYAKHEAFFPSQSVQGNKYWPPVNRVDNVHGDRNLVCACPPLDAYDAAAD